MSFKKWKNRTKEENLTENDVLAEVDSVEDVAESDEPLDPREQYEKMRADSQKMRKKVLIASTVIVLSAVVLFFGVSALVNALRKKPGIKDGTYRFYSYPPSEKVVSDYMEKNRFVIYCYNPSGEGLREAITETNRTKFDATVLFLCDYLDAVIAGDFTAYRSFFADKCWKENTEICKKAFNPQMIYEPLITYREFTNDGADRLITYQLEYFIYHNDGSFRRDIGSGISRPQYVTVRVTPDGTMQIDLMRTVYSMN
ncbi:MAG: hypothetical protein E7637_00610 [Ruminococcaceae bacterium]|nr:hypothetical protein [Oscillospiraceae bacterium]